MLHAFLCFSKCTVRLNKTHSGLEILLLLLCSHSPNEVTPEPQRNVSIAAVRGAVHPSKLEILLINDCLYTITKKNNSDSDWRSLFQTFRPLSPLQAPYTTRDLSPWFKQYFIHRKHIQSTLVTSKSKGPSKTPLQDICTSTYQICSIEEKTIQTTLFHK